MPGIKIPAGPEEAAVLKETAGLISKSGEAALGGQAKAAEVQKLPQSNIPNSPEKFALEAEKVSAEIPGKQMIPVRELFLNTAAAMGFPKDILSTALLAFIRFFSLSPSLLGNLRREILASLRTSSPGIPGEKAALEAKALALVAALDKGVTLKPAALEHYARYFMPPVNEKSDRPLPDREFPEAEELRIIAEEEAEGDDLLALLNYLPGKNGQKWTVFPFRIKIKGIELNVFLRVSENLLITDIAGPKRQWRCLIKKTAHKFRADIRVFPKTSERALKRLSKKAEAYLGESSFLKSGGFEEILVQNGEELPSWVEKLFSDPLPLLNKEV